MLFLKQEGTASQLLILSIVATIAIFLIDLALPLGVAAGIPYVLLVLIWMWSPAKNPSYLAALIGTGMIIIGFFLSPDGGQLWKVLINRFLAIFIIWITAILSIARKQAEADLLQHKDHLEELVQERTTTLQNEINQRKIAQEDREKLINQLEIKNAELTRFAYTISHDLKSPLVTIQGFLGELEEDALAGNIEDVRESSTFIRDATRTMNTLLNDLLHLSLIGRVSNPSQNVSLNNLVQECVGLVTGQIAERGVEVNVEVDLPSVYGDRTRLLEMLQNLLVNAIKYMGDQPTPHIEIGTRKDGAKTICYVKDNGIGIAPEFHESIFGLFKKVSGNDMGSGVGLALVKAIIEGHGGYIWVESQGVGHGSTFCFTLNWVDSCQ